MELSAPALAAALGGRKSGSRYVACCPAHDDSRPSLSITTGEDGRVLFHCFTGCSQQAVLEALQAKGLWSRPEQKQYSPAEKKRWTRLKAEAEDLASQARLWRVGKLRQLEQQKKLAYQQLPHEGPRWLDWAAYCRELYLLQTASGTALIRRYVEARNQSLAEVREAISFARSEEAADRRFAAIYVACLAIMEPKVRDAE